jgi:hypothetical protein
MTAWSPHHLHQLRRTAGAARENEVEATALSPECNQSPSKVLSSPRSAIERPMVRRLHADLEHKLEPRNAQCRSETSAPPGHCCACLRANDDKP